ncbi:hypothetical protein J437_LFUL013878 [Ladona fulva]|uniref:Uncharacterized protein n=1 Tax=Ladona fulva TaxID=123851 RepID=A0A8K0KIN2_LADFU|nr:hypothetical protein J437_LFUL013878 [Ladona fulva]
MSQMRSKSLVHFPIMKKMMNDGNFEPLRFTGHLKTLLNQFEKQFQDFSCLEPVNDIILQAHATDVDFWKVVEKDRSVAYKIKSCFGSTYLCGGSGRTRAGSLIRILKVACVQEPQRTYLIYEYWWTKFSVKIRFKCNTMSRRDTTM